MSYRHLQLIQFLLDVLLHSVERSDVQEHLVHGAVQLHSRIQNNSDGENRKKKTSLSNQNYIREALIISAPDT